MTYALAILRYRRPLDKQGMASYELLPWAPTIGKETLDRM